MPTIQLPTTTKNEDEKIIKGLFVQKLCSSVLVYDDFADEISQKRQHGVQINNMMLWKLFDSIYFIGTVGFRNAANYTGIHSVPITTTHDFFSL